MLVRTTVDIPGRLHDALRRRAEQTGTSIGSLIIRAIEQAYAKPKDHGFVKGPMVKGSSKLGPAFPQDENPHDLLFS